MADLLSYLLKKGLCTSGDTFPDLDECAQMLPAISADAGCQGEGCDACVSACPTGAVALGPGDKSVALDLGACIGCRACIESCPAGVFVANPSTKTSVRQREHLVLPGSDAGARPAATASPSPFRRSLAVRVVSTGCSACDLEVGATANAIFDIERFGVQIVASPRAADALVVTGPVPLAMHDALRRTYDAMAEPRLVIAAGTCAISGGVHAGGYADANGVASVIPVDVFVPGCPPHPWSLIHAVLTAMGRL